jgi:hypothetical protein
MTLQVLQACPAEDPACMQMRLLLLHLWHC